MLRALIFDFDGTILDTESADYACWRQIYEDHGCELKLDLWQRVVGTAYDEFDPYDHLADLSGRTVDRAVIKASHRAQFHPMVNDQPAMPGVREVIGEALDSGLQLAVASSSEREWVVRHLECRDLLGCFHAICTASDVKRIKPAPDLYLLALERLGVTPEETLAIEDSVNGMNAALAAGLRVIAVPNAVTRTMDFARACARLDTLEGVGLSDLSRLGQARS
jgi:HAD superfamily hydrolase (TIGR01509 family)